MAIIFCKQTIIIPNLSLLKAKENLICIIKFNHLNWKSEVRMLNFSVNGAQMSLRWREDSDWKMDEEELEMFAAAFERDGYC